MACESNGDGRMLAVERRQRILEMLSEGSSVRVGEVSRACGVSAVTSRGDLDYLEGEGLLRRTHGGAVAISDYVPVRQSDEDRRSQRAKQVIGRRAAELVGDGETILVGSGSTMLEFVKALRDKSSLTIIGNDVDVLAYATDHLPDPTVVATGGQYDRARRHLFGPFLAASLADVILDKVFVGADSFDPELGFLAEFEMTAFAKVEFMRHARKSVVLMDSSKVSRGLSAMRFARPSEVDVVVMDVDPGGVVRAACNAGEKDVEVIEAVGA